MAGKISQKPHAAEIAINDRTIAVKGDLDSEASGEALRVPHDFGSRTTR